MGLRVVIEHKSLRHRPPQDPHVIPPPQTRPHERAISSRIFPARHHPKLATPLAQSPPFLALHRSATIQFPFKSSNEIDAHRIRIQCTQNPLPSSDEAETTRVEANETDGSREERAKISVRQTSSFKKNKKNPSEITERRPPGYQE